MLRFKKIYLVEYPKKFRRSESEILSVFSPKILDEKFGACDKIYIRYPTKAVFFQCGTSLKTQTEFIPFISQSTIFVYGTLKPRTNYYIDSKLFFIIKYKETDKP